MLVTILECVEHGRQGVIGVARLGSGEPHVVLTMDDGDVIASIGTFIRPLCLHCDEPLRFKYYEFTG